jgi:hypothetical protein
MRNLLWIVFILGVTACQPVTLQHRDGPVPVVLRVDDAAYWLEEWHQVIALPEDQLALSLKARETEFTESPTPRSTMRLALLLTEGPRSVRNQSRALTLLEEFDTGQASDSEKALAALLKQIIAEQQWSNYEVIKLNRKLNDSRTRIEELENQLQELTNIEQNIQQRELPGSTKEP